MRPQLHAKRYFLFCWCGGHFEIKEPKKVVTDVNQGQGSSDKWWCFFFFTTVHNTRTALCVCGKYIPLMSEVFLKAIGFMLLYNVRFSAGVVVQTGTWGSRGAQRSWPRFTDKWPDLQGYLGWAESSERSAGRARGGTEDLRGWTANKEPN